MSLVTYSELVEFVRTGVIENCDEGQVNAASIDVRLGSTVQIEQDAWMGHAPTRVLDFRERAEMKMHTIEIPPEGITIMPGQCFLAHTIEKFYLPLDVAAEFKLKSSTARRFLQHMLAGWCDPGWNNSVLTLEFKNVSQHHAIRLRTGDAVGQVVFFHGDRVPFEQSYAARGRYNGDLTVQGVKK